MTPTAHTAQRILRRQSIGAVRLVGRQVVWRCSHDEYAIWPEGNVYSAPPSGRRYSLSQAIEALTHEEVPA